MKTTTCYYTNLTEEAIKHLETLKYTIEEETVTDGDYSSIIIDLQGKVFWISDTTGIKNFESFLAEHFEGTIIPISQAGLKAIC